MANTTRLRAIQYIDFLATWLIYQRTGAGERPMKRVASLRDLDGPRASAHSGAPLGEGERARPELARGCGPHFRLEHLVHVEA